MDRLAAARHRHDPVVPRWPLRPVEPRRDGDGARRRRLPRRAPSAPTSGWPTSSAPTAAGGTTTSPTGRVEEAKLDTNVCAYIATGVWHHWLCTGDRGLRRHLWPTVRARPRLGAVDAPRRRHGAVGVQRRRPSVGLRPAHRIVDRSPTRCGAARSLAELVNEPRPDWVAAGRPCCARGHQRAPECVRAEGPLGDGLVLPGADRRADRRAAPRPGWPTAGTTFAMEGRGIRCVSDEPWVTASETAECAIAHAAIGDLATATDLLRWTRRHRRHDGAYYTGLVYPDRDPRSPSTRRPPTPAPR